MSMYGSYDPFQGTYNGINPYAGISGYNPSYVTGQNSTAATMATAAYQQSMAQNQSDQLAFAKAQAAFTDAMSLGSAYGYSMGGNPYNFGSMMLPSAGTPLQSTMNQMGYAGAIPGYTGYDTGQTASYQQQLASMAAQAAGITGNYVASAATPYSPGTFVQVDPGQLPDSFKQAGGNYALGYVTPSGQIQQLSQQQAQQMGYNPSNAQNITFQQFEQLVAAPPQQTPQQSLQSVQAYQSMNQAANQSALATSQATGMYSAPGQVLAPGYNKAGQSFYDLPYQTQQQYLSYYKDPQSAMQGWVNDTNNALNQASGGNYQGVTATGTPTETMAAQQQYYNQAQQLAQMYGGYYAPGAPGQTAQAGVNAPQAGQETLAAQQQAAGIAAQQAQLLGYYNTPSMYTPGSYVQDPSTGGYYQVQSNGALSPVSALPQGVTAQQGTPGIGATAGQQGQQTLAGQQQYWSQGFQQEQFQQQAAQSYLQLLSQLQGPADYGKYLNVLGSTPSGIQGLVGAAAGNYVPGTGSTGVAPQGQTLSNLVNAATGSYNNQQGGGSNLAQQNYNSLMGAANGQGGAGYGAGSTGTGGGSAAAGGMNYSDYMAMAQGLPAPNQIAPQAFGNMTPSQQQMMGGMYQQLGYYGPDINAMYQQSLPKYAAGSSSGNFRLV